MSNTTSSPRRVVAALGASLAIAVAGATVVPQATAMPAEHRSAEHRASVQRLHAHLVPSGDPNGSGEARFTFNRARQRVCADVEWHRIGAPAAAHIHRHSDGSIVVDLSGSVTGGARCATGVRKPLIRRILTYPGRYYFNVHNARYPDGAIQGTLRR
jgi:hypothetical protein